MKIGKQIKTLADIIFASITVPSVILFFIAITQNEPIGLVFLVVGPFVAWTSSIMIRGFGELIEKTAEIAKNTAHVSSGISSRETPVSSYLADIEANLPDM